jgi:dipeptidyl aminopeptidase/acylaminoacyl peptidase
MKKTVRSRPFNQDDVFRLKFINNAALSPDGKSIAYVLSETLSVKGKERQSTSIWLLDVSSQKSKRLTQGTRNDSNPVFTKDGLSLLFLSLRNKVPQIFIINLDGGEAQAVTSLPQGAGPFSLSPDGRWIAFASVEKAVDRKAIAEHKRVSRSWYRFDPLPGYIQDSGQALFIVKVAGGKPKPLSPFIGIVGNILWSPDSNEIAFTVMGEEHHEFVESDLNIVSRSGKCRTLIQNKVMALSFWTRDGKQLGILASEGSLAKQNQLMLISRQGGKPRSRTRKLDLMVGGAVHVSSPARTLQTCQLSDDGKSAYVPVSSGGELRIYKVALSGKESCEPVIRGQKVHHLLAGNSDQLIVTSQDLNSPPELYSFSLSDGKETQLTHVNQELTDKIRWPDHERIQVKSAPGVEIEGWLLKPRHMRAPYKTILCIHGGPHAGYGHSFNCDYQELIGDGYAVLIANPRGSTGYGDAFSESIFGQWGELEAQDFNALLNSLVRRGLSHKDKLGVTGVSGGGHLSGWLIGHSNRFKAAVPEQGVYNMLSMWGTSDAGKALIELEMGGPIHKIPDTYWKLSPVAYAHKCKTPTLLIQGENDIRCPMEQAEQMYAALQHHGCRVELLRLNNCSHGAQVGGDPALRRFRMDALKDWFRQYIV